jgi:cobalt-zinc-cadmium efflux system protein
MPHSHPHLLTGRRLLWSLALTVAFVVGETLAGVLSHSLGLLSDAGHNLADVLALLFSWYALRAARFPSSASRTFGYHRVGILAALLNALSLIVIAGLIIWQAFDRLHHPARVEGGVMIGVATIAVLLNGAIAWGLHGASEGDLNIRSAYLHMLGDAISAAAVVVAGIIVLITGKWIADPIVSILIGGLILYSTWGVLKESINVLLEAAPAGLDMAAVCRAIRGVAGVIDMHDLHVWTLGPGVVACSCHIVVAEQSISDGQQVLRAVGDELSHHFHINHTTIQIEVEGCEPNHMYCTIHPGTSRHDHADDCGAHTHAH